MFFSKQIRAHALRAVAAATFLVPCLSLAASGPPPDGAQGAAGRGGVSRPAAAAPAPATGTPTTVSLRMTFVEPSGTTLAERRLDLAFGKVETVAVQQGARTVSAEATVVRGAKAGCHRIDITLRDKTIDASGHFNKTVWQSGSEPCDSMPITLGPKDEVRLQIAITPLR